MTSSFATLCRNLKKDFSGLAKVRVAVLGDSSTQHLAQALRGHGHDVGLDVEIFDADHGQIERQIFDRTSDLYTFKPEVVVIVPTAQKLLAAWCKTRIEQRRKVADEYLATVGALIDALTASLPSARVIYSNLVELEDGVFGNFANKVGGSFLHAVRRINLGLMELAQEAGNLFIHDMSLLERGCGAVTTFDPRLYVTADMVFSLDFLPIVARSLTDMILAMRGRIRKCLVLDLDNVVWGGIIGDDGMENLSLGDLGIGKAFTELQWWAHSLKERGVLLAACSKNDLEPVMEALQHHPDMVLRPDDFAIMKVNWENKVDNIRAIQAALNIGFESMVFLDDSPFERDMVRSFLPEVTVPELPEDPSEYMPFLRVLNLFETASWSGEDQVRTAQYRDEAQRSAFRQALGTEEEYLQGLDMEATVRMADQHDFPRVAQLSQRSNQFNLRTVRYSQQEIETMAHSQRYLLLSYRLRDRFGDYGLIGVVILDREASPAALFIDTWIMSCRVLKRGMEAFMLNHAVAVAQRENATSLVGEYLPTAKNGLVRDHYERSGFSRAGQHWELDLAGYAPRATCIRTKEPVPA